MPIARVSSRSLIALIATAASAASAAVYTDSTADQAGTNTQVMDFSSVEVTNDATNISFKINLVGDIAMAGVSDFGNYHIGFDTTPGGKTTPGVLWGQTFGLSSGMDYWIGSWVNFGGGSELHQWNGADWDATIPGTSVGLGTFSTTITIPLAAMGLSNGSTVVFDVWSTFGSPGGQSAYDASSNPAIAIADPWNGTAYDASTAGAGGTPLVSSYTVSSSVVSGNWNVNSNGNWSDGSNWTGGTAPNGVGHIANFTGAITTPQTVTVDAPQIIGTINFDNAVSYTINGTSPLTLDAASGPAQINVLTGSHTISAPINLADDATVTVTPAGSTLSLTGALGASGRSLTKSGAGTAQFENIRAAALNVAAGAVRVSTKGSANDPAGTSVVNTLSISTGAQLDLTNNSAVVDYTDPVGTLVDDVRQHLAAGRLTTSSPSTANRLGYGDNAVLGFGTFAGQTVDASSILIKYTISGDANLDGITDITDFSLLTAKFNQPSVWTGGDFDYDGMTAIGDFSLLASFFNQSLASGAPRSTVPEPAMSVLIAPALLALRRRRVP